ncbi:MAG: helix-turn-helix transcriptional regulator [Deltaproteobacteria bacterium]|nr:helix-turn-helix transcriptional regulator [Deltaproteobacteria bacterium]
MSVGRRIRQLRLKTKRTQREISEQTGLAVSYLSRLENGRITPSVRTLTKLSTALAVPVTSFFDSERVLEQGDRCPVSLSGQCILEHAFVGRGRRPNTPEPYSQKQLEILRQCNYLLHKGDKDLLMTLSTIMKSLLMLTGKGKKTEAV